MTNKKLNDYYEYDKCGGEYVDNKLLNNLSNCSFHFWSSPNKSSKEKSCLVVETTTPSVNQLDFDWAANEIEDEFKL